MFSAAAWTFGPKLTFSSDLPPPLGRMESPQPLVLLILGLFAWHLKATLLIHKNQKE